MAGWITQLQKKPRAVRQRYAYGGSFLITALIVGIWATTQTVPTLEPVAAATDESSGAFGRFFETVRGQSASVVASFKGEKTATTTQDTNTNTATSTSNITLPQITDDTRAAAQMKRATSTDTASSTEDASSTPRAVIFATSSPKTTE